MPSALSVFKAMLDSPTPEEFLDKLIEAVEKNKWDYQKTLSEKEVAMLKNEAGENKFQGVAFIGKGNAGKKLAYLHVDRIEIRDPKELARRKKAVSSPRIMLLNALPLPLDEEGWTEAVGIADEHVEPHPSERGKGSISHYLLFPFSVVKHWQDARKSKEYPRIQVFVDSGKFDELNKYRHATEAVSGYLTTLEHLKGEKGDLRYAKQLRLDRLGGKAAGKKPLDQFLIIKRPYHGFFKELGAIAQMEKTGSKSDIFEKRAAAVEDAIALHFGLKKSAFTRRLAENTGTSFNHGGNRIAAAQLAEKTRSLENASFRKKNLRGTGRRTYQRR